MGTMLAQWMRTAGLSADGRKMAPMHLGTVCTSTGWTMALLAYATVASCPGRVNLKQRAHLVDGSALMDTLLENVRNHRWEAVPRMIAILAPADSASAARGRVLPADQGQVMARQPELVQGRTQLEVTANPNPGAIHLQDLRVRVEAQTMNPYIADVALTDHGELQGRLRLEGDDALVVVVPNFDNGLERFDADMVARMAAEARAAEMARVHQMLAYILTPQETGARRRSQVTSWLEDSRRVQAMNNDWLSSLCAMMESWYILMDQNVDEEVVPDWEWETVTERNRVFGSLTVPRWFKHVIACLDTEAPAGNAERGATSEIRNKALTWDITLHELAMRESPAWEACRAARTNKFNRTQVNYATLLDEFHARWDCMTLLPDLPEPWDIQWHGPNEWAAMSHLERMEVIDARADWDFMLREREATYLDHLHRAEVCELVGTTLMFLNVMMCQERSWCMTTLPRWSPEGHIQWLGPIMWEREVRPVGPLREFDCGGRHARTFLPETRCLPLCQEEAMLLAFRRQGDAVWRIWAQDYLYVAHPTVLLAVSRHPAWRLLALDSAHSARAFLRRNLAAVDEVVYGQMIPPMLKDEGLAEFSRPERASTFRLPPMPRRAPPRF